MIVVRGFGDFSQFLAVVRAVAKVPFRNPFGPCHRARHTPRGGGKLYSLYFGGSKWAEIKSKHVIDLTNKNNEETYVDRMRSREGYLSNVA